MASDEWIFLHALHAKILAKQKALRKEPSTPPEPLTRTSANTSRTGDLPMADISGKIVLITAAAQGIGLASVQAFVKAYKDFVKDPKKPTSDPM